MRYRKKPIVVEAFRLGYGLVPDWFIDAVRNAGWHVRSEIKFHYGGEIEMQIRTAEGTMYANRGDYIIKGIEGEIYPCKADIFEKTYERAEDDATV